MATSKLSVTKDGVLCGTFETGKSIAEFKEEFFPGEVVEITWIGGDIPPSKEVPAVAEEAVAEEAVAEEAVAEKAVAEPEAQVEGEVGEGTTEAPPAE